MLSKTEENVWHCYHNVNFYITMGNFLFFITNIKTSEMDRYTLV